MNVLEIIQGGIEDFLKDKFKDQVKDNLFFFKLKNTVKQTFNEDALAGFIEQQDTNTYVVDFISILRNTLFDRIIVMLTEINSKKADDTRKEIYSIAHSVTDQSKEQIQIINILLEQIIFSIEYCWSISLDKDGKFLYRKIQEDNAIETISASVTTHINYNGIAKFQNKFNSFLFLEKENGKRLSDVYIVPQIKISGGKEVMCENEIYSYIKNIVDFKINQNIVFDYLFISSHKPV